MASSFASNEGTPATLAIAWIRRHAPAYGSLRASARAYARRNPWPVAGLMDELGCWPSSEPELRALQEVW